MLHAPSLFCIVGVILVSIALVCLGLVSGIFGFRIGGINLWMGSSIINLMACASFLGAVVSSLWLMAKRQRPDWWLLASLTALVVWICLVGQGLWSIGD
jgi:hypothetical protein